MSMISNEWIPESVKQNLAGRQQKQVTGPCARATNGVLFYFIPEVVVTTEYQTKTRHHEIDPEVICSQESGPFLDGK